MVVNIKKTLLLVLLLFSFSYLLSQTDSVIRVRFYADAEPFTDYYFNYMKIKKNDLNKIKNWDYKIKYIKSKKTEKKLGFYCEYGAIIILSKEILIVNDTIIIKSFSDKKKLRQFLLDQEIVAIKKIQKDEAIEKFGWWRGRYGAIIIETKNK